MTTALPEAPSDLEAISTQESSLLFPTFTADTAYILGTALYTRLRSLSPSPCVINITLANSSQLLFHACTHPGTSPDNDVWVARKRATVMRWGCSSWYMNRKFAGSFEMSGEKEFAQNYMLGESAGSYAIHGGGVPVRVKGVEGVVGVVVVSGLKQHEDHAVVVEGMGEVIKELEVNG
ncbi:hypothetical protein OEA41_004748 [Lepraria neglecta]|uniref:DUF967 domain protein n=1 Tax=Lepraria neglecta TaxID=209136 RepID=A0AAD9YYI1_9LECA|nr:hypothetical protein OEA41_004748 [Lepraria neglecta]